MSARKYELFNKNRLFGLVYISPHPTYPGHNVCSAVPVEPEGESADNISASKFDHAFYEIHTDSLNDEAIIADLLNKANLALANVRVQRASET